MPKEKKTRLLMIEDNPVESRLIQAHLRSESLEISSATTGQEGLDLLSTSPPDILLLDLNLPDISGTEILEWIQNKGLEMTTIVLTGNASLETAISTMRLGAFDYIVKPFDANRLKITLRNAVERQNLHSLVQDYRKDYNEGRFCGFIGDSPAMQSVYRTIEAAASSKATIFITGESGTGKELCAEAIHTLSQRAKKPLVAINCAAIPHDLLESQIFGHIKGAFTGATANRDGAATQANGGTLFLDEICEMSLDLQAKLLRFVQTGSFQKVGASTTDTVDVRFVCATNRDPWAEVQQGRMREDLFYRMHVIPIELPPLRARKTDTMAIAQSLLEDYARHEGKKFRGFDAEATNALKDSEWPGNVRQLQNVIRQIVVLNQGEIVTKDILPSLMPANATIPDHNPPAPSVERNQVSAMQPVPAATAVGTDNIRPLWRVEREVIENAINHCQGNIPKAAHQLGISPSTIYRKQQSWKTVDQNKKTASREMAPDSETDYSLTPTDGETTRLIN